MPLFPILGKNGQQNFNTRTRKLVRLGDRILLVLQWWWSAVDRLHRERRQKPLKRTSFNLKELLFIVSQKCDLFIYEVCSFLLFSLFAILENAAKLTKLSARTYGELVSVQLVYSKHFSISRCFALDVIYLWFKKVIYLSIIQRLIKKCNNFCW